MCQLSPYCCCSDFLYALRFNLIPKSCIVKRENSVCIRSAQTAVCSCCEYTIRLSLNFIIKAMNNERNEEGMSFSLFGGHFIFACIHLTLCCLHFPNLRQVLENKIRWNSSQIIQMSFLISHTSCICVCFCCRFIVQLIYLFDCPHTDVRKKTV